MRIRWRNLELPSGVKVDRDSLTASFGRFTIEPFERGFGHTIGNGLRRVLLSSIEGTAPRWFKMSGALHEFQPVEGVVEDVTDIVLQVKQLLVKIGGDGPVMLRLRRKEKGPIVAGDFLVEGDAEVVNPDLPICTLSKAMDFEMEVEVCRGRGYVTAEENEAGGGRHSDSGARRGQREVDQEIGKIWVDSIFSPILRVSYATQDTRVGRLTDYDKLIIDVWTDGTIRPDEALAEASKIYRKFLNPLCSFGVPGPEVPVVDQRETEEYIADIDPETLARPISDLDLSVRSSNCLEGEKIITIGDLLRRSEAELMSIRNFGKTSMTEIREKLDEFGLRLAGDPVDD